MGFRGFIVLAILDLFKVLKEKEGNIWVLFKRGFFICNNLIK
jgi:regulator of replication initiation timing